MKKTGTRDKAARRQGKGFQRSAFSIQRFLHPLSLILPPLLLLLLSGCIPTQPSAPKAYFGPTESMQQVVTAINANNNQILTLWTRVKYFEADVREERGGKKQFVNGSGGYLLMRRPGDMRLRATKAGIGPVLDVGANSENVWLIAPPADKAWWAKRANIGKPCVESMPIDPASVMAVLGVDPIDTNFLRAPIPVMRFNNDRDVYMIVWHSQSAATPSRWIARREIWYDRQSKLPVLVNLFDDNGRIIVSAYLSEYTVVTGTSAKIASRFQLFFPETDSHFTFSLEDVKLKSGDFPNDRSFMFNPNYTGVSDVQQMDGNCK